MRHAGARAFTLIEVLTVVSILVILAGMMVRGGSPARQTIELDRNTAEIADMFRTARQSSITVVEHAGVYPSYGVVVGPGSTDGSFGGLATLYAREVANAVDPGRSEVCYATNGTGVYTIREHIFTGGVYISNIRHTEYLTNSSPITTLSAGNSNNISVLFVRPLPTTFMAKSSNAPNHCGGGNTPFKTGSLEITLSHISDSSKQRIISVNNAGNVQVRMP